jgi:hypothetical protein
MKEQFILLFTCVLLFAGCIQGNKEKSKNNELRDSLFYDTIKCDAQELLNNNNIGIIDGVYDLKNNLCYYGGTSKGSRKISTSYTTYKGSFSEKNSGQCLVFAFISGFAHFEEFYRGIFFLFDENGKLIKKSKVLGGDALSIIKVSDIDNDGIFEILFYQGQMINSKGIFGNYYLYWGFPDKIIISKKCDNYE